MTKLPISGGQSDRLLGGERLHRTVQRLLVGEDDLADAAVAGLVRAACAGRELSAAVGGDARELRRAFLLQVAARLE